MIICWTNRKGGCGKSTLAAISLAGLKNSLGIDMDTQLNLTSFVKGEKDAPCNLFDILTGKAPVENAIQHLGFCDFITGGEELITLNDVDMSVTPALQELVEPLKKQYKHIILDTSAALDRLTTAALGVADYVIVPLTARGSAPLDGVEQLMRIVNIVKETANPNLKFAGFVFTQYNAKTILAREMTKAAYDVAAQMGTRVFNTVIRDAIAICESQLLGENIFDYAQNTPVVEDCCKFIKELESVING